MGPWLPEDTVTGQQVYVAPSKYLEHCFAAKPGRRGQGAAAGLAGKVPMDGEELRDEF